MKGIERVYKFLDEAQVYYLATMDGDQPRVRALGTVLLYDGKLYIQTGKIKPAQIKLAECPLTHLLVDARTVGLPRVHGKVLG